MRYAICRWCHHEIHEVLRASGRKEWSNTASMCPTFCAAADGRPHEPESAVQVMLADSEIAMIWRALAVDARLDTVARDRVAALRDRFAAIHPNNERRVLP